MPPLNTGKLRHRVVIQKPVETQDTTTGAMNTVWEDVATVWASIDPVSAKEFVAAQVEQSKITGRITIRYRNDFDTSCRLYHRAKNKYYNIEGMLSDRDSGLEYLTLPVSDGIRYVNAPIGSVPIILAQPVIAGQPIIGLSIVSSSGVWANEPTSYEYQWYLNDLPVGGATDSEWIISGDIDDIVTVGVKAINEAGVSVENFSDGLIISP